MLQCRNNRNSHLPWVPLHSPNPLLLLRTHLGMTFGEFIDISAFDDTPTPDLVAGSSTNPSPESSSDQASFGQRRFFSPDS